MDGMDHIALGCSNPTIRGTSLDTMEVLAFAFKPSEKARTGHPLLLWMPFVVEGTYSYFEP
eukprot:scaffold292727_cov18-Tisochrysis_lutea.AAC.1